MYAEKKGAATRRDIGPATRIAKDDSPGANDNAIGTVGVLETARVRRVSVRATIRFLFCNEEHTPWTSAGARTPSREAIRSSRCSVRRDGAGEERRRAYLNRLHGFLAGGSS